MLLIYKFNPGKLFMVEKIMQMLEKQSFIMDCQSPSSEDTAKSQAKMFIVNQLKALLTIFHQQQKEYV